VDAGGKVAFNLKGGRITVTRVTDEPHEDPAIASFLALLEKDIQCGRHTTALPHDLARSMLAVLGKPVDLNEDIVGNVAL
jgi:antitoxin PrlF